MKTEKKLQAFFIFKKIKLKKKHVGLYHSWKRIKSISFSMKFKCKNWMVKKRKSGKQNISKKNTEDYKMY